MKFNYKTSAKRLSPLIALDNDHSCRSMQLLQAMNGFCFSSAFLLDHKNNCFISLSFQLLLLTLHEET